MFKLPGFMTEFVTPIVGASVYLAFGLRSAVHLTEVKVSRRNFTQQFFTMQAI